MSSLNYRFPKAARLLSRGEYRQVAQKGKQHVGAYIVADVCSLSSDDPSKIGITVTKKFGKAHQRNRFKRLIREAFRSLQHQFPKGKRFIIRPRKAALLASYQEILSELSSLKEAF